jgi:hypothetical protein
MSAPRPISKSSFKVGLSCLTKLYYKRQGYPHSGNDDPYLEFLADGGFMVEAIARAHFPKGITVEAQAGESDARATERALAQAGDIELFEPTFEWNGLSARVDILVRRGNRIRLIEVKAASFNSAEDGPSPFRGKRGGIAAGWKPYLEDLAFQALVLQNALGDGYEIAPQLCLVDTAKTCCEDLVFKRIELLPRTDREFGKPAAIFKGDPTTVIRDSFVAFVDAAGEVGEILSEIEAQTKDMRKLFLVDTPARVQTPLGRGCRDCEFRGAAAAEEPDGFRECWGRLASAEHHVLDLYRIDILDGRDGTGVQRLVDLGVSDIRQIPESMIDRATSTGFRQSMQVECARTGTLHLSPEIKPALDAAAFPLHFVDFETSRLAVPYHAGMRPYEQIAFQFSCHTIARKGADLTHREWINTEDAYPNFEFARQLRDAIGDSGSMLVWSPHERSALVDIARQMAHYGETDPELKAWIDRLVVPVGEGGRMLDLHELCRCYYMHPRMKGRTSIKAVLPAVWEEDAAVRSHPWFREYLREEAGRPVSPYDALAGALVSGGEIDAVKDGTGAMRTYQEMMYGLRRGDRQYRETHRRLLLQYCKLDTAAMVMVWMHWNHLLGQAR